MTHLISFVAIAAIAISLMAPTIMADNPPTQPQPSTGGTIVVIDFRLKPIRNPWDRPQAPSRVYLNCSYSAANGLMWFDGIETDEITVTITGLTTGTTLEFVTAHGVPNYVGTISEDVQLTCTTSDNQIFEGTIFLSDIE